MSKNNVNSNKKAFSVFNKAGKLLVRFGRIGQGPNDFEQQVIFSNQIQRNKKGDICIWLYEINHYRMRMVNLSKTIKNKTVIIEKEIDVAGLGDPFTPYYINSSLIVGNISNLDLNMDKLRFYNPITKKVVKRVALLPQVEKPSNDMAEIQYNYNFLFTNLLSYQHQKGFVAVMCSMDRMDFMDLHGNITKTIANGIAQKSSASFSDFPKDKDRIVYCCEMTTTDKYVFVLYNGKNNFRNINRKDNVIKVYDWNGRLKSIFNPNEPLIQIAVDEAENIIYGVTEDYDVYKYKVKLL